MGGWSKWKFESENWGFQKRFYSFENPLLIWTFQFEGYRMVFAGICEHASNASFFASTNSDQICLASSEH